MFTSDETKGLRGERAMNLRSHIRSALALTSIALLSACSSTPDRIEELETARSVVAQVEASPRAGIAAENISEARKSLDRATAAAEHGDLGDVKYHANIAATQAQI